MRRSAVGQKLTIIKLGLRQVQVGSMCSLSITEHNPTIRMSKFILGEPHTRCEHAVNTTDAPRPTLADTSIPVGAGTGVDTPWCRRNGKQQRLGQDRVLRVLYNGRQECSKKELKE